MSTPVLNQANSPENRAKVEVLAADASWLASVMNDYPAPIAHEYQRLHAVLEEGLLVTAVLQLKDVVEVLFKFPTVVMAQWVLTQGTDEALKQETLAKLLGKKLSLGDWQQLADFLAIRLVRCEQAEIAGLAQWFRVLPQNETAKPKKLTDLHNVLNKLVNWRNDAVGHGALRLSIEEYLPDLTNYIQQLNAALGKIPTDWQAAHLLAANGEVLQGAACLRKRHEGQAEQPHPEEEIALMWQLADGFALPLSPYLSLRKCMVCDKQDVFFFDGRDGKENKYKIAFLDYLAGHKMMRPGLAVPDLAEPLSAAAAAAVLPDDEPLGGDFIKASLDTLLQEKSLEAEYLSPTYLREPLQAFIEAHDCGVFWLQAPAHVGKSLFVQGLAEAYLDEPLLDDADALKVVRFHVRREYRYHLNFFIDLLRDNLKTVLDVRAGSARLPEFNDYASQSPTDLSQAFADWLAAWLAVYRQLHREPEARLLLCVDGLDEFTGSESPCILDLLPSQLTAGCYLLLTSRPLAECAPRVQSYLAAFHQHKTE